MPTSPIPVNDSDLVTWLPAFANKFTQHSATLNYDPAIVSAVQADCAALLYELQIRVPAMRNYLSSAITYKDLLSDGPEGSPSNPPVLPMIAPAPPTVAPGVLIRLRRIAQEIKKNQNYSDAIGADLGINATPGGIKPTAPTLTLEKASAGNVIIRWNKLGWQGIKVQGRIPTAASWTDLGVDMFSPFVDTRPLDTPGQAQVIEYRACYLVSDQPTQEWSNILAVTISPA